MGVGCRAWAADFTPLSSTRRALCAVGRSSACAQAHVTLMALCGMTAPHVTTIAHVVSTLRDNIAQAFAAVLPSNVAFFRGRDHAEPRRTRCACSNASMRPRDANNTGDGSPRSNRCLPMCAIPNGGIASRFTLHGCTKVTGQWLLFCLVHHIEKLTHAGYAASIAMQETRAQLQNGAKRRRMPSEQRPALVLVASRAFCDTRHLGAERVEAFSAASTLGYAAP